tara:strand:+ start:5171 stop:6211 length:1041 start_codon:yes stop_codon:yes gene_type:complete
MLSGTYFYNATVKRIVSVFGTLFNNIKIARHDSGVTTNTIHVPISYGPKQKFLARINEASTLDGQGVAIKLPRMSFEMTDISYDLSSKLNKLNKLASGSSFKTKTTIFQSVPYVIGMQLNIMAKNQDDALQIVEQILPTFSPEYTVTIKGIDGPNSKTDVPFVLSSVTFEDTYEGDFQTRRVITYTLNFTIRVKFAHGTSTGSIINRVAAQIADMDVVKTVNIIDQSPSSQSPSNSPSFYSQVSVRADSPGGPIRTFTSFIDPDDTYTLTFNDTPSYAVGEQIIGSTSLNAATIRTVTFSANNSPKVTANELEGLFTVNETVTGQNSPTSASDSPKSVTLASIVKS